MVRLSELLEALGGERIGKKADPRITDVHLDSRRVGKGELFAALPGSVVDGARYAADAVARGAAAVLSPNPIEGLSRPNWVHPGARGVAGRAAAHVHGNPGRAQAVIGVTGTNGKTTVAHMTGELLGSMGRKPGVIGTVAVRLYGADPLPATHTTPDACELQRLAARNLALGGDCFVLEASSHALDQERLSGLELDVAIFTNLSRDHLDYHASLEAYATAKERIFEHLKEGGVAVVNLDDPAAKRMIRAAEKKKARVITYGTRSPRAILSASLSDAGPLGSHLFLRGMGIPRTGFFLPLVGRHNIENALAATAAVLSVEASPSRVLEGLASISSPPGRLERVDTKDTGLKVFVDYAHTPDALERVLVALRELMTLDDDESHAILEGRLICLFGCGGNRDRDKRAPMGEVVGRLADTAILTSDNPRFEDPEAIIEDVLVGLRGHHADVVVECDRRSAIRRALRMTSRADVLLIAGKGHETWQRIRERRVPFEDGKVVLEELP